MCSSILSKHIDSDDQAYQYVFQQPDEAGHVGVSLSWALLHVAVKALRNNMSELGPLVLPYAWPVIRKKLLLLKSHKGTYVPKFKKALEHFCIHASGRGVLDGVVDSLKLHKEDREPSRMTFHKW